MKWVNGVLVVCCGGGWFDGDSVLGGCFCMLCVCVYCGDVVCGARVAVLLSPVVGV